MHIVIGTLAKCLSYSGYEISSFSVCTSHIYWADSETILSPVSIITVLMWLWWMMPCWLLAAAAAAVMVSCNGVSVWLTGRPYGATSGYPPRTCRQRHGHRASSHQLRRQRQRQRRGICRSTTHLTSAHLPITVSGSVWSARSFDCMCIQYGRRTDVFLSVAGYGHVIRQGWRSRGTWEGAKPPLSH